MFNTNKSENDYLNIPYGNLLLFLFMATIIIFSSNIAFVSSALATSNDIIGDTLCNVVYNLTGNIAKSIATIAIFAIGVGLFLGKINWSLALATSAGVGIIFSATPLINWILGGDQITACEQSTISVTLPQ
jgi:type IV secretory pathway VirB2 component (pilin)